MGQTARHLAHRMQGWIAGRADSSAGRISIPEVPFTTGTSVLLRAFTHHGSTADHFACIVGHIRQLLQSEVIRKYLSLS